ASVPSLPLRPRRTSVVLVTRGAARDGALRHAERSASISSRHPADRRAMKASLLLVSTALLPALAAAQQSVPFADGIPVAPELAVPPIPAEPKVYDTAEGMDIRVVVVARGLVHPYSIAFLPDGVML